MRMSAHHSQFFELHQSDINDRDTHLLFFRGLLNGMALSSLMWAGIVILVLST